jgi:NADH:ubiquinone oxidoreductase subunit E
VPTVYTHPNPSRECGVLTDERFFLKPRKNLLLLNLKFSIQEKKMAQRIEMQICLGSSCFSRGNRDVVAFIREYLKKNHLEDRIIFKGARCMDLCSKGPNLRINEKIIEEVTLSKIEGILEKELGNIK